MAITTAAINLARGRVISEELEAVMGPQCIAPSGTGPSERGSFGRQALVEAKMRSVRSFSLLLVALATFVAVVALRPAVADPERDDGRPVGATPGVAEVGSASGAGDGDDPGRGGPVPDNQAQVVTYTENVTIQTGDTPQLRIDQTGSSGFTPQTWDVAGNEANFFVRDADTGRLPFRVRPDAPESAIDIAASGNVGFGDASPDATINVQRGDGTAKILVEELIGTAARRTLFEIVNNGQASFTIRDQVGGVAGPNTWQFATRGGDAFEINKGGTGGTEFLIRGNGSVQMGPGATTNFNLSSTGNLTIAGTLTEGSSRAVKTAFEPVDPAAILAAVSELPVAEWSYRSDRGTRHLGPMAEDFAAMFGLGSDDTGIAALDEAGVALAAIQGLNLLIEEQRAQIEERDATIELLEERLALLEEAVAELSAGR